MLKQTADQSILSEDNILHKYLNERTDLRVVLATWNSFPTKEIQYSVGIPGGAESSSFIVFIKMDFS